MNTFPQGNSSGDCPTFYGTSDYSWGDQANNTAADTSDRKTHTKTITPVNARMLLQYHDYSEPLTVNGKQVGMVSLVGQVRSITPGTVSVNYLIEDDSGRIEAVHYVDEDMTGSVRPNTFVKVIGTVKAGGDQTMMTVYNISTVRDLHQVNAHKLELIVLPLRAAHNNAVASLMAQANIRGYVGLPAKSLVNQPMSTQPGCSSASPLFDITSLMRSGNISIKGNPFVPPRPAPVAVSRIPQNSFLNNCFSQPMNADARRIMLQIRSCKVDIGISVRELSAAFREVFNEKKLSENLEYLISEGHIYTTIDEFHFKSTDA